MSILRIVVVALILLAGCAAGKPQYWYREGADIKTTTADIFDCRVAANQGGQKVYRAEMIEIPCMQSRGYVISSKQPGS